MSNSDKDPGMSVDRNQVSGPKAMSRRSLLKGSVKAMPVVLTLHSGAALARSSNLISGAVGVAPAKDPHGRIMCLDTMSVDPDPAGLPNIYDLGPQPSARFYAINERKYYPEKDASNSLTAEQICDQGGTFYYKETGSKGVWQQTVPKNKGMLVSAGAFTSLAGAPIDIVDI